MKCKLFKKILQEIKIKSLVQLWKRCYQWNKPEADQSNAPRWTFPFISVEDPIPLLSSILKTRLDEVYPNVFIAFRIMLNCPNTVASAERNYSKLKLIKTFNRSHMTNSRLSSLAMLSIETSCVCPLDLEDVIKQWFSTLHGLWPPSKDSQHLWPPAHQ